MLAAVVRLADERPASRPTVVLACTVNEEHGFTGATHWAETYMGRKETKSKLLSRSPDACIVAEPTELNVVVGHVSEQNNHPEHLHATFESLRPRVKGLQFATQAHGAYWVSIAGGGAGGGSGMVDGAGITAPLFPEYASPL